MNCSNNNRIKMEKQQAQIQQNLNQDIDTLQNSVLSFLNTQSQSQLNKTIQELINTLNEHPKQKLVESVSLDFSKAILLLTNLIESYFNLQEDNSKKSNQKDLQIQQLSQLIVCYEREKQKSIDILGQEISTMQNNYYTIEKENDQIQAENQELENQLQELKVKNTKLTLDSSKIRISKKKLKNQNKNFKSQIQSLKDQLDEMKGECKQSNKRDKKNKKLSQKHSASQTEI